MGNKHLLLVVSSLMRHPGAQFGLGLLALVAYSLIIAGVVLPATIAATVSSLALLALGLAVAMLTLGRAGPLAPARLGGRAQQAQQRYQIGGLITLVVLFLALVLGGLSTSSGALWHCLDWPVCSADGSPAQLALLHRGLAGLATLLVAVLAISTWRNFAARMIRQAAGWALVLITLQNGLGLAQVVLARAAVELPLGLARGLHLAVGAAAWGALVVLATLGWRLPWGMGAATAPRQGAGAATATLRDYLSLTKPGVISLLILTTITTMYITPAGAPAIDLVLWTAVGGWLMAAGAHAINCYMDRDIDSNMGRTARRPIPSGRIPPWHALALGLLLGVVAFALLAGFVNWAAAWLALAGYLYYVLIYTRWLKRTSPSNIVIGGGAGAFPPLVGWAAATGGLTWGALLLWLIIFYWTPPHFWALALIRANDYARAGVPMLPVVAGNHETKWQIVLYSVQMLALTVMPAAVGMFGLPYLALAGVLGAIFLWYALRLLREPGITRAWGLYKYSLLYLALLFAAMVVDRVWLG